MSWWYCNGHRQTKRSNKYLVTKQQIWVFQRAIKCSILGVKRKDRVQNTILRSKTGIAVSRLQSWSISEWIFWSVWSLKGEQGNRVDTNRRQKTLRLPAEEILSWRPGFFQHGMGKAGRKLEWVEKTDDVPESRLWLDGTLCYEWSSVHIWCLYLVQAMPMDSGPWSQEAVFHVNHDFVALAYLSKKITYY